jgi:hypothetical protein
MRTAPRLAARTPALHHLVLDYLYRLRWFRLDANPIPAGTCTTVRWDVTQAEQAVLDGETVALNGSREICPDKPKTFTLWVSNPHNERTYTLTLGVTAQATATPTAAPATSTPRPTRAATQAATATSSVTPQPTAGDTATPTPSATSTEAVPTTPTPVVRETPHPTPTSTPTSTPRPSATPARAHTPTPTLIVAAEPESSSPLVGYAAFGVIAGALLIGLAWRLLQKS